MSDSDGREVFTDTTYPMAVEFSIKMGTMRKGADIVIFKPGGPRRQDGCRDCGGKA